MKFTKIKKLVLITTIVVMAYSNLYSQEVGARWGSDLDVGVTNADASNHFGQFRFQTNQSAFTLSNFGDRFGVHFTTGTDSRYYGTTELFSIKNNGNVGIGTAAPNKKFTVVGGSIQPAAGNNGDSGIYFPTDIGGGGGDEAYMRYYLEGGENTKLVIGTGNDPDDDIAFVQAGAERMTIINGNVGIGTTAPAERLHVAGSVKIDNGNLSYNNNGNGIIWGNNYSKIKDDVDLRILTDDRLNIGQCNAAGNMISTTIFADVVSQRVGIGNIVPKTSLDVSGAVSIRGNNALEFGSDVPGKQIDAGKICYGCFDLGQSLNIVGAGSTDKIRKVTMWSEGGLEVKGTVGIGRTPAADIQLAVKGSFNVSNSSDKTVFHVSSGKELVFVGTDAYTKFQAASATGSIQTNLFSLWVSKGVNATDFAMSDITAWNDFVFDKEYKLPSLSETAAYITTNKHLPYIPSEKEVLSKGYSVHQLNRGFLQTIEEITLHSIEQEKKINAQEAQLKIQQEALQTMATALAKIEAMLEVKR